MAEINEILISITRDGHGEEPQHVDGLVGYVARHEDVVVGGGLRLQLDRPLEAEGG
jgi:hypothetical protein